MWKVDLSTTFHWVSQLSLHVTAQYRLSIVRAPVPRLYVLLSR